ITSYCHQDHGNTQKKTQGCTSISLISTPRLTSSSRTAFTSATTICRPFCDPGGMSVMCEMCPTSRYRGEPVTARADQTPPKEAGVDQPRIRRTHEAPKA